MAHLAVPTIQTYLSLLDSYRQGLYVSPRVLHAILQYLTIAIAQSRTWKVIKPHCQVEIFNYLVLRFLYLWISHSHLKC